MNDLGTWKHKITGEIYEIKQLSNRSKDLVMQFKYGSITKPIEPFSLIENWNRYGFFKKI